MIAFDLDDTLIEFHHVIVDCPQCDGTGWIDDVNHCLACIAGHKRFHRQETYHEVTPLHERVEILDELRVSGHRLAIVTNQTDIGFGRITPEDIEAKVDLVQQTFGQEFEWMILMGSPGAEWPWCDQSLVLPRKPNPIGLIQLGREFPDDPIVAFVGDSQSDKIAAQLADVNFLDVTYFFEHNGWRRFARPNVPPRLTSKVQ